MLWVSLAVVVAVLKCVGGIGAALVGGAGSVGLPYGTAQYVMLTISFSATAGVLIAARTEDRRAVWLGCILLLTATPFAETLLAYRGTAVPSLAGGRLFLERLPIVPLLPVFLWLFVRDFPQASTSRIGRMAARAGVVASLAIALLLIASNLSEFVWPLHPSAPGGDPRATISRSILRSLYWILINGASLPCLAYLAVKTKSAKPADRHRVRIFVAGLVLGFMPIATDVLLEATVPSYATFMGAFDVWITRVIFVSLVAVPIVTAYSVLFDRVVEVRLVIRSALQYALAKYTLLALVFVPLAGIAWYLYRHRSDTLLRLVSGSGLLLLIGTALAAALLFRIRHRALKALDHRFFREQYDARLILGDLAHECRRATTVDELVRLVCREVDRALHLDYAMVLLATPDGSVFRSPDDRIRPLARTSGLALLVQGDRAPLVVDLQRPDSILRRLPDEERLWLSDAGFGLLVPLGSADGSLLGLLGLGHKRSDLPFSREDRLLLEAIGGSISLTIENRRLRESAGSGPHPPPAAGPASPRRPDDGRPAEECEACGRLYAPETTTCDCGSPLDASMVPFVLAGKFQFDRRLGRGGMGVVYRALDQDLGRHVAIKTLPFVGAGGGVRLRREAQAMASVHHENLAVIFGAESWRGTPMLVVELLDGGTLAARLKRGPLPVPRALEIGDALAKGVAYLHQARVLHCDIKPSNIAFTRNGTPKLLDFGLATILRDKAIAPNATTLSDTAAERLGRSTPFEEEFAGTPMYMSPEALQGLPRQPSADIWSLTVVLYESIAGVPPFRGSTRGEIKHAVLSGDVADVRMIAPDCPPPVAEFLAKALSRGSRRPVSAVQFAAEISRLRESLHLAGA